MGEPIKAGPFCVPAAVSRPAILLSPVEVNTTMAMLRAKFRKQLSRQAKTERFILSFVLPSLALLD